MNQIVQVLEHLRVSWSVPRYATHSGTVTPGPLVCSFEPPSDAKDIENASTEFLIPKELADLWQFCGGATLFKDEQYGQWGLQLFSPEGALSATKKFSGDRGSDYAAGDLVIGEFIGDSDLLLLRCDPSLDSYSAVLIALPVDERADWDRAADTLKSFLEKYVQAEGGKFWHCG
jgi:hypothetical protein